MQSALRSAMNTKQLRRLLITVSIAGFVGALIPVGLWLGWPRALASNAVLALVAGFLVTVTIALALRCCSRKWLLPWLALQTVGNTLTVAAIVAVMLRSYDIVDALLEAAFGSWIMAFIALLFGRRRGPTDIR